MIEIQELALCKICKEPINNFVCIDCFAKDIRKWMPTDIAGRFARFNRSFLKIFQFEHHSKLVKHHLVCTENSKGSVCLYCYLNEVFQWLMWQNKAVARRFRRLFSFGMKKEDFTEIWKAHAEPITRTENWENEFGICDECGEYTEELRIVNGRWMCIRCGSD